MSGTQHETAKKALELSAKYRHMAHTCRSISANYEEQARIYDEMAKMSEKEGAFECH